jgi:hypothetical protein
MKWQPIETAPKDQEIWLFAQSFPRPVVGYWNRCLGEGWWSTHDREASGTVRVDSYTHWMPLPSSPQAQSSDEEPALAGDEVSAASREASLTQQNISLRADVSNAERRAEDAEARNVFLETEIATLYAKVAKS